MAKPAILESIRGKYPYMAIVTWEHPDDKAMVERLFRAYGGSEEGDIPWKSIQTYYAIGARKVVIIGTADSPLDIQKISSFFIFDNSIQIEMHHVLAAADLVQINPIKALK